MIRAWMIVLMATLTATAGGPAMETMSSPAGASSGEADLIVVGDQLVMTWIESREHKSGALKLSRFDGDNWSEPVTVVDRDDLFINWADFPRVQQSGDLLAVTWPQMLGDESPYAYGVRIRISGDGGGTWQEADWLHADRQPTEHGFVSMAATKDGELAAVWLDGNAMPDGGAMQLRMRTISANQMGPEIVVDDSSCECCGTDLLVHDGQVMAAYRDKTDDHIRDIYLASIDGGKVTKSQAVNDDQWNIHGCPVNGPALARQGEMVVAGWFTAAQGKGEVKVALSRDGGASFAAPIVLSTVGQGRVDLTFTGKHAVAVSWVESGEEAGLLRLQRLDLSDKLTLNGDAITVSETPAGRASGFPRLVAYGDQLILAYPSPAEDRLALTSITWP